MAVATAQKLSSEIDGISHYLAPRRADLNSAAALAIDPTYSPNSRAIVGVHHAQFE